MNTEQTQRKPWQAVAIYTGIAMIITSAVLSIATAIGLVELDTFEFVGHSGLRSLAGLAVGGCVTAAIGFWDE
ncbi:hypothetical protein N9S63_01300 [OM182 bacterium]|nr:hypothetical protein [OM182 bacterium]